MFAKLFRLPTISADEVEAQLGQLYVVDNNPVWVWKEAHVPGAVNLDPGDYRASDLPTDKTRPLVFYCSGPLCPMAPGAASRARKMGYQRVFVMTDGIAGWKEKGKAVEAQP